MLLLATPAVNAQDRDDYEPSYGVIFSGFSGLLDLPTSDTLQKGKFSLGGYHRNIDREFSDVDMNTIYAAFGMGVTGNLEMGLSVMPFRQGDFDADSGYFDNDFPWPSATIENGTGDILGGFKYRFVDFDQWGSGLAAGFNIKFPMGNTRRGLGTGGTDLDFSLIGSGRAGRGLQLTGDVGYILTGKAKQDASNDEMELADEVHYGVGAAFPARGFLRGIVEFSGIHHVNEEVYPVVNGVAVEQEDVRDLTVGFRLHSHGFGFAGGYKRLLGVDENLIDHPDGWTLAVTYTDWDRPVVEPPPPPQEKPFVNYDPTASIKPEKAEAYVNQTVRLDSDTSDPNGDNLEYQWTASSGEISGSGPFVAFTPPKNQEGNYKIALHVADGRGGSATDSVIIKIKEDPLHPVWLTDVLFDLNKYTLSPKGSEELDLVAAHLRKYPNLKLKVTGYTCSLGTEDYNLALGYHRAKAIKKYLVDAGVDPSRIMTVSYGENWPAFDNSTEETRQYNRRGTFKFSFVDTM